MSQDDPTILQTQPDNVNTLQQNKYRFLVRRLPNVNYFCRLATLPSLSVGAVERITPFRNLPTPGTRLVYDQSLTLEFAVDEDLKNYFEIHDWLVGLGFPDDFSQRKDLVTKKAEIKNQQGIGKPWTDGTLWVNTSANNPNIEIHFLDIFPTSLSGLTFDSRIAKIEPQHATVIFAFSKFEFPNR